MIYNPNEMEVTFNKLKSENLKQNKKILLQKQFLFHIFFFNLSIYGIFFNHFWFLLQQTFKNTN